MSERFNQGNKTMPMKVYWVGAVGKHMYMQSCI